jgi:hypothetical protein
VNRLFSGSYVVAPLRLGKAPRRRYNDKMTARYLLLLRAGDNSLHPRWLSPSVPRLWDLHLSYFGKRENPFGTLPPGVSLSREPGTKFIGLADCMDRHPEFLERYEYIGLPDDDLDADTACWNTAFSTLDRLGAAMGQPSLDWRSYYYHDIVLRRPQYEYRVTDFVELMAPIVRRDFLREIIPTWRYNQSSIGLDYLWRIKACREGRKLVIVDACAMYHTRPMEGGTQYKAARRASGKTKDQELRELFDRFSVTDLSRHTLYGVLADGTRVDDQAPLNEKLLGPKLAQKRRLRWAKLKRLIGLGGGRSLGTVHNRLKRVLEK